MPNDPMPRILRDARFIVCQALVNGGLNAALAALAAQSIRLTHHVEEGSLTWKAAFRTLLQVAVNLRLVQRVGKSRVRAAIYAGREFLADVA
jgi:hypothetical protein